MRAKKGITNSRVPGVTTRVKILKLHASYAETSPLSREATGERTSCTCGHIRNGVTLLVHHQTIISARSKREIIYGNVTAVALRFDYRRTRVKIAKLYFAM